MKTFSTKRKAFTLIELLIVIAIIGILFIVLVSKVDFATDKAKATGVQTDFRSFQMAFDTVAKENAGFNTFGWDTGDANQDGIRNSYDEGDNGAGGGIAKNGVQDGAEVFTGRKVYDETFTKAYSLKKNGTGNYDRDALNRLETAINANLDPKLHITIKDDGEIVMANGAQDPWNKEYHGYYITNAENDKKDRGAIVMYSDGANNEFGSKHTIANGVVNVIVPDNNKAGKDDYSIVSCYTYVNGYGEIKNVTTGFSNNQQFLTGNGGNVNSEETDDNVVTPQEPEHSTGLEYELNEDGVSYSVIGIGTCTDTDIVIPTTHQGLPVTALKPHIELVEAFGSIYEQAFGTFDSCETIKSITIPDSVTSICDSAFTNSSIESVTIGNSVTSISDYAFAGCKSLVNVTISDSVTSIGNRAFSSCSNLTDITIPNSVTNIGEAAFIDCSSLKSLTVGNSVLSIGTNAFYGCKSLSDIYITDIAKWCAMTCDKSYANPLDYAKNLYLNGELVTDLEIPNGVTKINPSVFALYKNLTSVTIPDSVTSIGDNAFCGCTGLTSVIIPDSVTSLKVYAFSGCTGLTSVTIGRGLRSIEDNVFMNCDSLTDVTIPDSVTSIGQYAFNSCDNIKNIYITDIAKWCISGNSNSNPFVNVENLYLNGELVTDLEIPNGVTKIKPHVFASFDSIISVTIPDSVTSIGKEAFDYCRNLTSVNIGNSVTSIEQNAFFGCSSLENIVFEGTIEQWENVSKGRSWNYTVPATYVQCTDGQATL